jgi:hypothetical protein
LTTCSSGLALLPVAPLVVWAWLPLVVRAWPPLVVWAWLPLVVRAWPPLVVWA